VLRPYLPKHHCSTSSRGHRVLGSVAWLFLTLVPAAAQDWDLGARGATALSNVTDHTLQLNFEQRVRYEDRTGNNFGKDVDTSNGLVRFRFGLTYTPLPWLKLSGMVQDSRAPGYGPGAPNNLRDPADWHEGYIELFPAAKKGFGATVGRMMIAYGDGRLIGTPQWSNLARTYDQARIYWRASRFRIELLAVSIVKVRIGEFNFPVPGDRVWGTYNSFPNIFGKQLLEAYVLRHQQNRPGGFTGDSKSDGTDKLANTTFGFHLAGPLSHGVKYSLEAALQRGMVGPAELDAAAGAAVLSRRWNVSGHPLDVGAEYKYASGTANPADPTRTGTFDQLYPANHDKFGHEDLFGWRNIHNARSFADFGITKALAIHFMYDNYWLANAKDALYNGTGRAIVRSATGSAGRHAGQETDVFGTYKRGHFTFGGGYGHFFPGVFILKTTPGVGPTYLYVFQTYSL